LTLPERDLGYLADIRTYAARAMLHVEGATLEQFMSTDTMIDAVIRCLIVIGEAAARLSPDARAELPQLDWSGMSGMRHRLVHDYGRIRHHLVWDVVQTDLPTVVEQLGLFFARTE
jgi:uncharacterized protein with HEPN domain